MAREYLDIAGTPTVLAAQEANGSRRAYERVQGRRPAERLSQTEIDFIALRDTFYMATVSESGWPYVQHRGGPVGFLSVLDDQTLAFADFRGNQQYISLGNLAANNRVALILMDYPNRRRLKIFAHATEKDLAADPALAAKVIAPDYEAKAERAFLLHVETFDWNCPQHITPRFTAAQVRAVVAPLQRQIAELQARLAKAGLG